MPEEKIDFAKLDIDTNALEGKQARLIQQITELREAQRDLKKETDNLSKATDEQAKTYVNQDATLKKLNTEYNQQKAILAEVQNGTKGLTDALTKQNKTEKEAADNNKELIKIRKQLDKTTKEGQKATEEINKKIDENNKFLKENSSQLEQQRLNIGNYASALDKVVPGLGRFVQGLNATRLAMLAIPIIALVSGIASLVQAFASTQRGMDEINKVLRPAQVLFEKLIGFIQDIALSTFDKLKEAVNNPKEALRELADVVIENLVNRFKSVLVLGEAIGKLFEGDFSGAAKTAADAFIQLTTGIEDGTNKLSKAGEAISQFVEEGVAQGEELDRIIKQLEQREIDLTVPLAKARNELKNFKKDAEDISRTEEERLVDIDKAMERQEFITREQIKSLNLKIKQAELEKSLNDTSNEQELEYQKLLAQRYELQEAGTETLTTLQNQRNTILSQQEAKRKKALQDELKAEEEKAIKARDFKRQQRAIEFQQELLDLEEHGSDKEAIRLAQLQYDQQLAIEAATREIENAELREQAITNINRQYALQRQAIQLEEAEARARANKDAANSIIEVFGEQSLVGRAAAIYNTTIATHEAAMQAYKALAGIPVIGPALGATAAGVISAKGFNNVRKIASQPVPKIQKFATGTEYVHGPGTETSDSIPTMLSKGERVLTARQNRGVGGLSNDQLVSAATMYKSFVLNGLVSSPGMSDNRIVKGLSSVEKSINRKPIAYPHIDKNGIYTIVDDGQNIKKLDHDYYHG